MKPRILFSFTIIAVFLISGCTTMMLFDKRDESGSLYREINRTQHFQHISYYRSNFIGYTERNGYQYARILIHNPRSCVTQDHQIELLLPLTPDKAALPLLIESDEPINNNGNPVNIVGDSNPKSKGGEILDKEKWAGFPTTIFANSPSLSYVSYRIGPELSARREDKTVDNLSWVCRSYVEHNILLIFLPITVAIDIISSPVQFIVFHFNLIRLN
jgi:hypothetical protein